MKYLILGLLALAVNSSLTYQLPLPIRPLCARTDLLTNGEFEDNKCQTKCCFYNKANYKNQIIGWTPQPQIQMCNGNIYSDYLTTEKVIELDASKNTCLKQVVPRVKKGTYKIEVVYGARRGVKLVDCELSVKFAGKVIKKFNPVNYQLNVEVMQVNINNDAVSVQLQVCGEGINNGFGAFVKEVKLKSMTK